MSNRSTNSTDVNYFGRGVNQSQLKEGENCIRKWISIWIEKVSR